MAKYLLLASYSAEGSKGLMKDGGTKRVTAARTLVESLGGKLERCISRSATPTSWRLWTCRTTPRPQLRR